VKTVSQHRAETRHKQDAPGHYTLVSCMRLRVRCLCCRVYVVIVALAILNSRMMLVCYYRGRFTVLTMLMCYDRVLAMLALCVLHVCSSLSSASALALKGPPQPQHSTISSSSTTCVKPLCSHRPAWPTAAIRSTLETRPAS
jgi:hypothetical protein